MSIYQTIKFETEKGIATIWLNRPEIHNAFNHIMLSEIIDCIEKINHENSILCLVLRGMGKSFCAGVDLNWMKQAPKNTYQQNYSESMQLSKCFYELYTCLKPTIALVHGVSLGGANGLLAACDFAYCTDDAVFSLSEVKIGIVPACISPYIIKRTGEYAAKDLMLTGRRIIGKEAEWFRLVNKSLPAENLNDYVASVISHFRTSGPKAMTHCKNLIFKIANELTLEQAYQYTAAMIADIRASDEGQEGMTAFLEKRKPNWIL
jgi:methylglutaconyl-CoA hydratase